MFGSVAVSQLLFTELSGITAVTSAVSTRIIGLPVATQGTAFPVCLFSPEASSYGTPGFATNRIDAEELRFSVKFMAKGTSLSPIWQAATAQLEHFDGNSFTHTFDDDTYQIVFDALGELPLTTLVDGADVYRQLGTIYRVHVTRGG